MDAFQRQKIIRHHAGENREQDAGVFAKERPQLRFKEEIEKAHQINESEQAANEEEQQE